MNKEKSFTLIELLVVIAIVGLLAAMIAVNLKGIREKAKITRLRVFSESIHHSVSENVAYFDFESGDFTDIMNNYELYPPGFGLPSGMTIIHDKYLGEVLNITWDYVNLSEKPPFKSKSESGALTVEAFFMPFSGFNDSFAIATQRVMQGGWILELVNGEMRFDLWNNVTEGCRLAVSDAVLFDKWNHVAASYDGNGNLRLFVNGKEYFGTVTFDGGCSGPLHAPRPCCPPGGDFPLRVGGGVTVGLIDDIRVYFEAPQ